MAVKASAQITITYVVDVKAVYRYYLLQSSTASTPSKPTTFPPSSSWDDTEPTYTEGSTNSLYFVDCTVLADDSFTYSEVSLSSSYEAAKVSYNKALAAISAAEIAQNAVDVATDVIVGTQTAVTGSWTGVAKFSELKDGQSIMYWLPYAGSGNATLNLTLADGSTTGAKYCYYNGTTRLTTHYPAGSIIRFVYRSGVAISGSGSYTGWWADANYDSNNYDRIRYQQAIKCGTTAIVAKNIIVGTSGVYKHLKAGTAFDITYPILYASAAISASATGTANYICIPFTVTTTQSMTLTAHKPVYIKGTLSGSMFTPISTTPLTQTVPTSADGYEYILLGQAYSTTSMYLLPEHPIFKYHNGEFKSFQQIAVEAAEAADSAQNDIDNAKTYTHTVLSVDSGSTLTYFDFSGYMEVGTLTDGTDVDSETYVRSSEYVKVIGGNTYIWEITDSSGTALTPVTHFYTYDSDNETYTYLSSQSSTTITSPSSTDDIYLRFTVALSSDDISNTSYELTLNDLDSIITSQTINVYSGTYTTLDSYMSLDASDYVWELTDTSALKNATELAEQLNEQLNDETDGVIKKLYTGIEEAKDSAEEAKRAVDNRQKYVQINPDDPSISLITSGDINNPGTKVVLDSNKISFYKGSTEGAYIGYVDSEQSDRTSMAVSKTYVTEMYPRVEDPTAQNTWIGQLCWVARTNGHLSLKVVK